MNLPNDVNKIIKKLKKNDFEAYAVGGCVRDSIMGVEPKDYDITTSATPEQIKSIFKKTIDTGIEHGTVTVVENGENYEITTYRIDGEYLDNRRPDKVVFTSNLKEDLLRRDFTINAIAYNEKEGYIDFFYGIKHIQEKKIIAVGDAEKRFNEDSLRIYRGIRFSCQLGFEIDRDTKNAMITKSNLTRNLSVERIREELIKALKSKYLDNLNTFIEIDVLKYFDYNLSKHFENNIDSIIENLKSISIDKKTTTNVLSILFFGLEEQEYKKQLKNLKLDNKTINEVTMTLGYLDTENENTLYFARKMLEKYKVFYFSILYIQKILLKVDNDYIVGNLHTVIKNKDPIILKDLEIDGNELQQKGILGKKIGETLKYILDEVHKQPKLNKKDKLLNIIDDLQNNKKNN